MRILNFDEFSLCYSTKKEHRWVYTPRCSLRRGVWTHRCKLHRQVRTPGVAYTGEYREDSTKKNFSQKLTGVGYTGESGLSGVGYTGESGLTGVGYTGESRLPDIAYTGESLVQPSMPASAPKGTIP